MLSQFRKSKIKRVAAVLAAAGAAAALSGCGASITVGAYTENGTRYNSYTLELDAELVQRMEATAAINADSGAPYTVSTYFFELFSSYDCEIVDSRYAGGAYTASYRKAFTAENVSAADDGKTFVEHTRLHDIAEAVEFTATYKTNPFVRKYVSKSKNPFNGVRAAYDAASPDETGTVIQRLKNGQFSIDGITGERIVFLPSVTEAFPYLNGISPDGLLLRYAQYGSKRMSSSGKTESVDGNTAEYVFSRYFDGADADIAFAYTRPVSYGWYLVALAAGGATLAVILAATRKKKQKPTLLDRFPYNPEEFRDYDSHLPTKL